MRAGSPRSALAGVGLVVLAAGGGAGLLGCRQAGPLSPTDMATLQTFALVPLPADDSNDVADLVLAARLGKQLYFDPRAAGPLGVYNVAGTNGSLGNAGEAGKVACISCHDPAAGGIDHRSAPSATSLGAGYTLRNAPTVINAAYSPLWQFWDGRTDSLWSQALVPPEGSNEEASSRLAIAHLVADHYAAPYTGVFGALPDISDPARFPASGKPLDPAWEAMTAADQTTINTIFANYGKAIAAYERRLVSPAFQPSAFDRFLAGDSAALSPAAIAGAEIFIGRGGCQECHRGPMFTDFQFHDIGAPQEGQYPPSVDNGRAAAIQVLKDSIFNRAGAFSDETGATDTVGLVETDDVGGRFQTPSLRNVSKTAPYMHDGVYGDLWDVVNHYNFGGESGNYSGEKDPAINPLLLTDADLDNLLEFLQSLEDGDPLYTADFSEGLTAPPPLPQ
jgi:cytochrome c peroxidase